MVSTVPRKAAPPAQAKTVVGKHVKKPAVDKKPKTPKKKPNAFIHALRKMLRRSYHPKRLKYVSDRISYAYPKKSTINGK